MKLPKLSYAIAFHNEIATIKNTLGLNLCNNALYADSIEFVIVDFSRKKDLHEWLIKNCDEALQSGYLKYYKTNELDSWHEAIAKNRATAYTLNEIIVHIDSVFIVNMECTAFILKTFLENKNTIVHIHTQQEKWHPGHLAISREDFIFSGRYDESLKPAGYHSMDLQNRLKHIGLKTVFYWQTNVDYPSVQPSALTCGYTYEKYNRMLYQNQITSKRNIAQGRLIANETPDNENTPTFIVKMEVAKLISTYLNRLIEQLYKHILLLDRADILNGQSGIVLLLHHYNRYHPQNKTIQNVSDKLLDIVLEKISKESEYEAVSIITSICYLMKDGFAETDTSIFEQIDNWLFDTENKNNSKTNLGEKIGTGLYIYHRILFSEVEDTIIWKERMKDFFKILYTLLSNSTYLFSFPICTCFDLSIILHLCSKFENDAYFQNEIDLIYKDIVPIIEISIREEDNHSDKYLISWLLKNTRLSQHYTPVANIWDSVTLMDIIHFFLHRYLLDLPIETPEMIEKQLISMIQNPKHIDQLHSFLTPKTCGLRHYVAGFAWALLQWSTEHEQKTNML